MMSAHCKNPSRKMEFEDYSDGTVSYNNVKLKSVPSLSTLNKTCDLNQEVLKDELFLNHTRKLNVTGKLDTMIFTFSTGNAVVDNFKYNFTYDLKNAVVSWYIEQSKDAIACRDVEIKLQFSTDDFQITSLNASHKSDALVVDIIKKTFLQSLLTEIRIQYTRSLKHNCLFLFVQFDNEKEIKFIEAYKTKILSALIESVTFYINSKGLNTLKVAPFNYSAEPGSIQLEQAYKDIEVTGLLNFVKYEARDAGYDLRLVTAPSNKFSDALLFTYPEAGEKQAFISYVMVDPSGESVKKFRVKRISISTTYTVALVGDRINVVRSRNESLNIGFLVKFEFYDLHSYNKDLIITHIENVIARALDGFVLN